MIASLVFANVSNGKALLLTAWSEHKKLKSRIDEDTIIQKMKKANKAAARDTAPQTG